MNPSTLVVLAGLALALPAQQPDSQPQKPAPVEGVQSRSTAELLQDLGSSSFKTRAQAERALRAQGSAALPELRKAAESSADAEVQWRARRLVRQIEQGQGGQLGERAARPDDAPDRRSPRAEVRDRFDDLFGDLERDFGFDIPRGRFFHDDFFKDLETQLQDMRQQMQQMQQGQGLGQGQSMQMQMGPDGVRVEMKTRNEKGEEEKKVYEAPDLQTFKTKYPGVLDQTGIGGVRILQGDDFRGFPGIRMLEPGRRFGLRMRDPGNDPTDPTDPMAGEPMPMDRVDMVPPPAGKRLGVVVRPEIPADVRSYLGIDSGLMVESVQAGTLAEALGIRAGDIVTEIAGHAIANTGDVQEALGGIEAGKKVEVTVIRRGAEKKLEATKPDAPRETGKGLEERTPGKLR